MNITLPRAVIEQALEALENLPALSWIPEQERTVFEAITALRTALEQPEQEPVAMRYDFDGYGYKYIDSGSGSNWQTRIKDAEPLYEGPQQRKPLTKEEIWKIYGLTGLGNGMAARFARAIEAAHGIKGDA